MKKHDTGCLSATIKIIQRWNLMKQVEKGSKVTKMYKRKQRRSAFLHSRLSLSDSGSVSLELMSLELTFAGVYSCWRHGVEYLLLSPLGIWQRWERNNRGEVALSCSITRQRDVASALPRSIISSKPMPALG